MDTPFLSVVIPAYNEERRILPTLQQVAEYLGAQPYTWTVVVVDDGSADRTAALVEEFSEGQPNVSLLSVSHGGQGLRGPRGYAARNRRVPVPVRRRPIDAHRSAGALSAAPADRVRHRRGLSGGARSAPV